MPDFEYQPEEQPASDYSPPRDHHDSGDPVESPAPESDAEVASESGPEFQLSFEEGRVLGCLIEKAKTTPDNYPLSLNGLLLAANQKSNRFPVTDLDEPDVEDAIDALREKKLAFRVDQAGARTAKFKHNAESTLEFYDEHIAILCVLLLRGPQTSGEIRSRTERLYRFDSVADVEEVLKEMMDKDEPLITILPPSSGKTVSRYHQTLAEFPLDLPEGGSSHSSFSSQPLRINRASPEQVEALEKRVEELESQIKELQEQFSIVRELLD